MSQLVVPVRYKRAQVYAAELSPAQAETFALQRAGVTAFFNEAVASQLDRWKHHAGVESCMSLSYAVSVARKAGCEFRHHGQTHPFTIVPSVMLHGALRQLSASWTRHFTMLKEGKPSSPPRFRSVHKGGSLYWQTQEGSVRCPLPGVIRPGRPGRAMLKVPGAIGLVKIRYHRVLPEDTLVGFASLRVDDTGRYWATVQYDTAEVRQPATSGVVGVDRGVTVTAMTSDGETYDAPGLSAGQQERKRRLQVAMARKRRLNPCRHDTWTQRNGRAHLLRGYCPPPGADGHDCDCWKHSRRYLRDKMAHLKLMQHETRQRTAGAHLASRALAARYATVVMENLDVSAMTASAKGTEDAPGRNVKQKTGLNREILAGNWYQLQQFVAYKTTLVKVPAPHTSQTCPGCGLVDAANRPSRAVFQCVGCGLSGHADIIAAGNIKDRFTAVAQTVAAREICQPVREQPVNSPNSIEAARLPSAAEPSGALVPSAWGLGPPRTRKHRRRRRARTQGCLTAQRGDMRA